MAAPPDGPDRRTELLDRVVDFVLAHGIAELTLRRVATAVGSNNRMLLYYFGSRDELIVSALEAAQYRFPRMPTLLDGLEDEAVPLADRLARVWRTLADPELLPYHRLFFQVFGLAGFEQQRFSRLLGVIGTEWTARVTAALASDGRSADEARVLAEQFVAVWRGLQATLISTGDRALVDRAAEASLRALLR
ncbi:TetR family transcriptional regulator [Nakamurella leprariae]|uniref:TetR/AcrR family transcriptional regulator n=1 Tax=Nakamurella leprariae TaxID=2803911 RepID=A0A938YJX6_9ACTN|nr:TetR family transcriptional regulator [Nakamurella leprariae]MBM9469657.1 TetR/AcrR family transcriptional regulator [Nakamurella leprariae]